MLIFFAILLSVIIIDADAETQAKPELQYDLFSATQLATGNCLKIVELLENQHLAYEVFKGRAQATDFTFLLGQYQTLINRDNRNKFNGIMANIIAKKFNFRQVSFPFAGNCEIDDFTPNLAEIELHTKIAFMDEGRKISYKLLRPKGYNWYIADIQIEGESLVKMFSKSFAQEISFSGFDKFIENLCNDSDFSKLGCKD